MAKSEASVEELVSKIERGELRLPEMQRRYVWRSTRVRDLIDSLYRGYPSGAILLWETDEVVPLQEMAISQDANPYRTTQLLLDGQQRLTSLAAVLRGKPVMVRGRKRPIELLFNLEHPDEIAFVTEVVEDGSESEDGLDGAEDTADSTEDEIQKRFDSMTFVVGTKRLAKLPHWVKVSEVFQAESDAEFLTRAGVQDFSDPRFDKYSKRLAKLRSVRKYAYRIDVLERGLSYEEVTEIFVRVNSLGAKLRSSDLALAQITAKWRDSLKEFQAFQRQCASAGFDLDLGGVHLRNLVAFATGQSRFRGVSGIPLAKLQASWKDCKEGMEFALNFLSSNVRIDSPALLASPFLVIAVAMFGHKRGYEIASAEAEELRRWVLLANAKGRYSRGSSETILDQDLAVIRDGGGPGKLIERLKTQVGQLLVSPRDLEGRNQRSALFKSMFLAFRDAGAKDWRSNLEIAVNHAGATHRLQFHHVFPKAVLAKAGYPARAVNDIANLSFISGKTNRQISDKEPAEYLPEYVANIGVEGFAKQCIPLKSDLLCVEAYYEFLEARRELISRRLNEYLGSAE